MLKWPEEQGAQCSTCPLRDSSSPPVPCSRATNPTLVIIGDSPSKKDVLTNRPLMGFSGHQLNKALRNAKVKRGDCHITNACLCRPDKSLNDKDWRKAVECCLPRLQKEIPDGNNTVLALGNQALYACTGRWSVTKWMGAPLVGERLRGEPQVLPSMHPQIFNKGAPHIAPVFHRYVHRAAMLARGELEPWVWPRLIVDPGPEMVEALDVICRYDGPIGFDIESYGTTVDAPILSLGFAIPNLAVSIPWDGYDTRKYGLVKPLLEQDCGHDIRRKALAIVASANEKVMHNAAHDMLGMQVKGHPLGGGVFDTLLAHYTCFPQQPHSLNFVPTLYYHAPRWKDEFKAHGDEKGAAAFVQVDPRELRTYNCKDAYMTLLIREKLLERLAETHNGWELYQEQIALLDVVMRMKLYGIKVDAEKHSQYGIEFRAKLDALREQWQSVVRNKRYTLGTIGTHPSLKKLFFSTLGVKPLKYSKITGKPKLDKATLEVISREDSFAGRAAKLALEYRMYGKLLSTYVDGLPVNEKGYIHPNFKTFGTETQRWACNEPNIMNQPKRMRDMYVVRDPANWIVGADLSQAELRMMALFAHYALWLEAYREGADLHTLTAIATFGEEAVKKKPTLRKICKSVNYAIGYGATAETVHEALTKSGVDIDLRTVSKVVDSWRKANHVIVDWQTGLKRKAHEEDYVENPLNGWRQYFWGMPEDPKVMNFPLQSSVASTMNKAALGIRAELNWGTEFILAQVHDELVLEGPDPDRLEALLKKHMDVTVEFEGDSIHIPIDIYRVKDMKKP